jgi:hypothetical protein
MVLSREKSLRPESDLDSWNASAGMQGDAASDEDASTQRRPAQVWAKNDAVGVPSAEGRAEAMQLFREANADDDNKARIAAIAADAEGGPAPKTTGVPSAEGRAEAMQLFREVNGDPAKAGAASAAIGVPSPEGRAEAMELFREVNADDDKKARIAAIAADAEGTAPKTGVPSPEGRAEAMQLFREVNGEAPAVGVPSPEGRAEAMQLFREVNGEPNKPIQEIAPKIEGSKETVTPTIERNDLVPAAVAGAKLDGPAADHKAAALAAELPQPSWPDKQLRAIQRELRRLGLYRLGIDGIFGKGTEIGLVEAFGGDEWRTMDGETCLTRLREAKAPTGKRGQHELRWGEMFKDGVLDMTVGLGFDEAGFNVAALSNLQNALVSHGFAMDAAAAAEVYQQAGRTPGGIGDFYVKKDAISYTPPAGNERKIHVVVRLIYSTDGSKGKEVAAAFKEGMVNSDIAYYTGHGRYGSGPDFDRNFTIDLLADDGSVEVSYDEYSDAEHALRKEGKPHGRTAWQQFLWRVDHKRIRVNGSNDGNVVLNTNNPHTGEFGSNLMYWNLTKNGGGVPKQTGEKGPLGAAADAAPDRKYRVMVFDGCRSVDYEKQLRKTHGFDERSADMFGSSVELNWGDEGNTLAAFLDSIISLQSAEQVAKNMDKQQSVGPGAYHAYGVEDNPIIK